MKTILRTKVRNAKNALNDHFFMSLFHLAIPIVIQNFMTAGLNLIDNIMVGQLGDSQIAAVGLANQVYFLVMLFLLAVSGGSSMFISQFWGKNDVKNIRRILGLGLLLVLSTCSIIVMIAALFPSAILHIFTPDQTVIRYGAPYLRITSFSYIVYAVSLIYSTTLRNTGHPRIPMFANLMGIIVNSVLNYMLIFGKLGFPALGVTGAGIATLIARLIECAIIIITVYSHDWPSSARIREMLDLNIHLIRRFFSQSGLLIFKDVIWAIGIAIYMAIYARMGTTVIAAINIMVAIQQFATVFFVAVATASQIMVGNLIGSEKYEMAFSYARRFLFIGAIGGVFIGIVLFLSRHLILMPYKTSETTLHDALKLIMVYSLYMPLSITNMISVVGILRSGGDTVICIIMDLIAVYLIGVPSALLGAFYWHFPVVYVYAMVLGQEFFKITVLLTRFISGKWIKNLVHGLE